MTSMISLSYIILILFYIFLTWRDCDIWHVLQFSSASKMNCNEKHQYFTGLLNNNRQLNINIEFYHSYLWKHCVMCVVLYRKSSVWPLPITGNNKILKTAIYEGLLCASPVLYKGIDLTVWCNLWNKQVIFFTLHLANFYLSLFTSKLRNYLLQEAFPNSPCQCPYHIVPLYHYNMR